MFCSMSLLSLSLSLSERERERERGRGRGRATAADSSKSNRGIYPLRKPPNPLFFLTPVNTTIEMYFPLVFVVGLMQLKPSKRPTNPNNQSTSFGPKYFYSRTNGTGHSEVRTVLEVTFLVHEKWLFSGAIVQASDKQS